MTSLKVFWTAWLAALLLSMTGAPVLAQKAGSVFKDCPDCAEMVVIPAGTFLMGSAPGPQTPKDEMPQHSVTVKSFAMGKYEVTQAEWIAVMGTNPSRDIGLNLPVENVSWNEAQAFIQKLNAKTGKRYRLPAEAEWEYAARAGGTTLYPFGDDLKQFPQYAWAAGNSGGTSHPVGEKPVNRFGLYDMAGNVWEWLEDCYKDSYVGAPADGRAVEPQGACDDRANRGGSWYSDPDNLRSAARSWISPGYRVPFLGFRLARTLP